MQRRKEFEKFVKNYFLRHYGNVLDVKEHNVDLGGSRVVELEISATKDVKAYVSFQDLEVHVDFKSLDNNGLANFLDYNVRGKADYKTGEKVMGRDRIIDPRIGARARRRLKRISGDNTELVCMVLKNSPNSVLFRDILDYMIMPVFRGYKSR